jgi:hypothetical protein
MCTDCRQIAEEYQELLEVRTQALSSAQHQVEQMQLELEREKRRADAFEKIAKIGLPDTIIAWMDKEIGKLLASGAGEDDRLRRAAQEWIAYHDKYGAREFNRRFGTMEVHGDEFIKFLREFLQQGSLRTLPTSET